MSTLFIGRDVITADNLAAAIERELAGTQINPEELAHDIAEIVGAQYGAQLEEIATKLDKLMEHLGAGE